MLYRGLVTEGSGTAPAVRLCLSPDRSVVIVGALLVLSNFVKNILEWKAQQDASERASEAVRTSAINRLARTKTMSIDSARDFVDRVMGGRLVPASDGE